jgi:hypothetical protein
MDGEKGKETARLTDEQILALHELMRRRDELAPDELAAVEAIARDAGISLGPPSQAEIEESMAAQSGRRGPLGRFLSGAAETAIAAPVAGLVGALAHPVETAKAIAGQAELLANPSLIPAAVRAAGAAGVPVVGPVIAPVAERLKQGDIAGAAGAAAGLALPAFIPKVARAAGVPSLLEKSAEAQYGRVLAPSRGLVSNALKEQTRAVVPEMIKRRVTAPTFSRLMAKAGSRAEDAAAELDRAWAALPESAKVKVEPLVDVMEDWKKRVTQVAGTGKTPEAAAAMSKAMTQVQLDLIDNADKLGEISAQSLRSFRQILDNVFKKPDGIWDPDVAAASRRRATLAAANIIRDELAKQFPDIAKINREFHFWQTAYDILDRTLTRRVGQERPLGEQLFGAGGMTGGLIKGGPAQAFGSAAAAATAVKLFRSTGWRTVSAVTKSRLANAISSGNAAKINEALALAANEIEGARNARQK